jgi:hypothetical protein
LRTMCEGNVLNKVRHFVIHKDLAGRCLRRYFEGYCNCRNRTHAA